MSCPTCDHTLSSIVPGVWWCERCGTVRSEAGEWVPKLVERCRLFRDNLARGIGGSLMSGYTGMVWHRLGIEESIALPEEGKTP